MQRKIVLAVALVGIACGIAFTVQSQTRKKYEVQPMSGSLLIDGYDFKSDVGPKATILYDIDKNEFRGTYIGLRMPPGRRAIFAWFHDTVNQKSEYIGPVGWLRVDTGGKKKGQFTIKVPDLSLTTLAH